MKQLVYTCVFGGYDLVLPPVHVERTIDYLIVTEDPKLRVRGWRTLVVSTERFDSLPLANRYYKMLGYREFPGYDCSLYLDGNIRLLGKTSDLLNTFCSDGAGLGVFRHPLRNNIQEESRACVASGKIAEGGSLETELGFYEREGFKADEQLFEAGILLRNHANPDLDETMSLWWKQYSRFRSRDQISLPYALWKTGISLMIQDFSFRSSNPWFGLYAHRRGFQIPRHYARVQGRSHDSILYRFLLNSWHFSWRVRRWFRNMNRNA
jgi:hypothetical protein